MTDIQQVNQLKFKISSLQSQLADKQRALEQYQTIQSQADAKMKALSKMHADKIKNLLNSIQILKKQKASVEGLSKQHKRSKLIEQLNKQISDQDLAIEVLRKWIYDKEGKEKGREVCDQIIVKALTKGPDRIRPLSREELRIEIDRLKSININLESKMKNGGGSGGKGNKKLADDDQISQISSVTEKSFVNSNDEIFQKLRQLQFENENMKLEVNAKLKIIQKLKVDLRQVQKLRTDLQISKNESEIANKKVSTYERLIKDSKQNTNAKLIELYQRQIKVEQLEMISRQNRDKLKQAQQTHSIILEQLKLQKEQLQAQYQTLKDQNQQLIIENISNKNRMQEEKKILKDLNQLNQKLKQDMKVSIKDLEKKLEKIVGENKKYIDDYNNIQVKLFEERAKWVDEKSKLLEDLKNTQENKANVELMNKYLEDIALLKKQNDELKSILQSGGKSTSDDKVLLARLAALEQKNKFLQSSQSGGKVSQNQTFNELYNTYNELLQKYEDLLKQFEAYRQKYGPKQKHKARKQFIQVTQKQKSEYEIMSSGISRLHLEDVDSDVLDNFDSSLEFQFVVNERGDKVKMPKLTEADRQLLKLMTSDLWNFVTDDKISKKIEKAVQFMSENEDEPVNVDFAQVRKLKNLSNPKGKKLVVYEEEVNKIEGMSDGVSVTSALDQELNKYDSDVNVEIRKLPKGASLKPLNKYKIQDASLSVEDDSSVSSAKLGQSNILKKKKKVEQKGSRIDRNKLRESQKSSQFENSSVGSQLIDSDVSSAGIRESQIAALDSEVEVDFKKKKK